MKSKTHKILVTVKTNVPVTRSDAVLNFDDCIWGEFYPCHPGTSNPDFNEFKITSVKSGGK